MDRRCSWNSADLAGYHLARALYDRIRETHSVEFHSGAYIIEDPNREVFEFLRRSPDCYSRISSHLKELGTSQPKQYGLDIPPLAYGTEDVVALKRTILFATFTIGGQPLLFFKPEEYGTKGVASILGHTRTFVQSTLLQMNVPHDNNIQRKERVPADFKEAFGQLLQRQRDSGLRKNADAEEQLRFDAAKKAGVFAMVAVLQQKEDDSADILKQYVAKNLIMRRDKDGTPCPSRVLPGELLRWEKGFSFRLGREVFIDAGSMKGVMELVHRAGRRHIALLQRLNRGAADEEGADGNAEVRPHSMSVDATSANATVRSTIQPFDAQHMGVDAMSTSTTSTSSSDISGVDAPADECTCRSAAIVTAVLPRRTRSSSAPGRLWGRGGAGAGAGAGAAGVGAAGAAAGGAAAAAAGATAGGEAALLDSSVVAGHKGSRDLRRGSSLCIFDESDVSISVGVGRCGEKRVGEGGGEGESQDKEQQEQAQSRRDAMERAMKEEQIRMEEEQERREAKKQKQAAVLAQTEVGVATPAVIKKGSTTQEPRESQEQQQRAQQSQEPQVEPKPKPEQAAQPMSWWSFMPTPAPEEECRNEGSISVSDLLVAIYDE
jgi:hypothetical protein